jgi:hypothetical protein
MRIVVLLTRHRTFSICVGKPKFQPIMRMLEYRTVRTKRMADAEEGRCGMWSFPRRSRSRVWVPVRMFILSIASVDQDGP